MCLTFCFSQSCFGFYRKSWAYLQVCTIFSSLNFMGWRVGGGGFRRLGLSKPSAWSTAICWLCKKKFGHCWFLYLFSPLKFSLIIKSILLRDPWLNGSSRMSTISDTGLYLHANKLQECNFICNTISYVTVLLKNLPWTPTAVHHKILVFKDYSVLPRCAW